MEEMGAVIVDILERAGARFLRHSEPELYRADLLNIGGADTVRRYDRTATYWERIQLILDGFFSARERAQICAEVIAHDALRAPVNVVECRILAQSMLAAALVAPPSPPDARSAVVRRAP